jgi:phage minor structural protein
MITIIRVYDSNEKLFATNGIKNLKPLRADVKKADNGDYYVEVKDILDNLDYYQEGMILRIPTPWGVQGFRCKNLAIKNNKVECKAWHLSYDSQNYIIKDSYAVDKNCNDALNHFNDATDTKSPFNVISDIGKVVSTRAVRKSLFEIFELFITEEKYGGHWYRDNFTFGIKSSIGEDRGVVLASNKNIIDIQVTENWDNVCTKILGYTTDGENEIFLDSGYMELQEQLYDIPYTKVVKFENELNKDDYSTYEEYVVASKIWLEEKVLNYLDQNKFPQINYSVSAKIDNISDVGDTLYVKHPKCRVNIQTQVISVTYDAIRKKYIKIEFGNFKREIKNLTQEITAEVSKNSEQLINDNKVLLQTELEQATAEINSVLGSSNVIVEGNQILVVDTLPKEEAKYVIRVNSAGIGFSSTGINGTFNSAWSIDGTLNMQMINVINLSASLIKGGVLKLGGLDNSSGTFELYDNSNRLISLMDRTGLTVYATNGDYVKLNAEEGLVGYDKTGHKTFSADGNVFVMYNAKIENELEIAGITKIVPVKTATNTGIGFVAISS